MPTAARKRPAYPDGTSPNMISMLTARAGFSRQESDNIFRSTAVNFFAA
ncbi:MAG: hypothetical protein ACXWYD_00950 [Candidatus Binatia bacterium]